MASTAIGAPLRPGSILWATAGDPRSLIPGTAAGIMQLMLPGLGAGVSDHSNFFEDPFDRIFRSVPYIWGSIFASDDDEGTARGHRIRDFHPTIKGTDHHGKPYHALDPDVFWWAHATFTWEMLRARELYFPVPLRRAQQRQLYAETVTWYRRYGVSDRAVPATLDEFRSRFDDICRHELELTPAVQWVLDPSSNPAARDGMVELPQALAPLAPLVGRLNADLTRILVYGSMPDVIRRRFEFPWSNADRIAFVNVCAWLRAAGPLVSRGAMEWMWPEGTPHLEPGRHDRIRVAGPNPRRSASPLRMAEVAD